MKIYSSKLKWKWWLFVAAVAIGVGSLLYTQYLSKKLSIEERKKVELWAEALKYLKNVGYDENSNFIFKILKDNKTVPVILVANDKKTIVSTRNLDSTKVDKPKYLKRQLELMKEEREPIVIEISEKEKNYVYYRDSVILNELYYYPIIQLGVMGLFIFIAYLAFSIAKRSEQNQVWVGMSKETAHQLGTPIMALMGWIEMMKMKHEDDPMLEEIEKDINRLNIIAERFSKIGSKPILKDINIIELLSNAIAYMKTRSSHNVKYKINFDQEKNIPIPLNNALFQWVIENLCKNAIDAMNNKGKIEISVGELNHQVIIDIEDTGKGLKKSKFTTIFKPGYTTKSRGWGLGLSLTKRIIEEYHEGKIFVKNSEINKGTTFRIILKKEKSEK